MLKNIQRRKLNTAGLLLTNTALVRSSQHAVDTCVSMYRSTVVVETARYDWHGAMDRQQLLKVRYCADGMLVCV